MENEKMKMTVGVRTIRNIIYRRPLQNQKISGPYNSDYLNWWPLELCPNLAATGVSEVKENQWSRSTKVSERGQEGQWARSTKVSEQGQRRSVSKVNEGQRARSTKVSEQGHELIEHQSHIKILSISVLLDGDERTDSSTIWMDRREWMSDRMCSPSGACMRHTNRSILWTSTTSAPLSINAPSSHLILTCMPCFGGIYTAHDCLLDLKYSSIYGHLILN